MSIQSNLGSWTCMRSILTSWTSMKIPKRPISIFRFELILISRISCKSDNFPWSKAIQLVRVWLHMIHSIFIKKLFVSKDQRPSYMWIWSFCSWHIHEKQRWFQKAIGTLVKYSTCWQVRNFLVTFLRGPLHEKTQPMRSFHHGLIYHIFWFICLIEELTAVVDTWGARGCNAPPPTMLDRAKDFLNNSVVCMRGYDS